MTAFSSLSQSISPRPIPHRHPAPCFYDRTLILYSPLHVMLLSFSFLELLHQPGQHCTVLRDLLSRISIVRELIRPLLTIFLSLFNRYEDRQVS
jgi:hypothetical protein